MYSTVSKNDYETSFVTHIFAEDPLHGGLAGEDGGWDTGPRVSSMSGLGVE